MVKKIFKNVLRMPFKRITAKEQKESKTFVVYELKKAPARTAGLPVIDGCYVNRFAEAKMCRDWIIAQGDKSNHYVVECQLNGKTQVLERVDFGWEHTRIFYYSYSYVSGAWKEFKHSKSMSCDEVAALG